MNPLDNLASFADLEDGWDSYGAPPITSAAIDAARRLIQSLGVTPTNSGGVSVYLASDGVQLEFDADGRLDDVWIAVRDVNDYLAAVAKREDGES